MSYMTLSSQEKHLFLFFSNFRAHPPTLRLKILGRRMHGPYPHLRLWGTVLPVPLGFRLWCLSSRRMLTYFHSYRRARELIIGKGFRDISHALRKPGQRRSRYSLKL